MSEVHEQTLREERFEWQIDSDEYDAYLDLFRTVCPKKEGADGFLAGNINALGSFLFCLKPPGPDAKIVFAKTGLPLEMMGKIWYACACASSLR